MLVELKLVERRYRAVIDVLDGMSVTVPPSEPGGGYQVCCPVHEDSNPSATVRTGDTVPLPFHCHKDCTQEEFIDALVELGVSKTLLKGNTKGRFPANVIRALSGVTPKAVRWQWPKRIAYGKITNFEGDPEHGKSLVTSNLAARATRGDAFPDGVIVAPAALLVIATEDDYEDTIVPRLAAAEADLNACFMLEVIQDTEGNPIPFTLPDDMDATHAGDR